MVDVVSKKAKKGTPEEPHGHRYRQHGVIMRGKKGSKDRTAEERMKG